MAQPGPDIVVIGGGMAGLAFAAALRDAPMNILVVDPAPQQSPDSWPDSFDPRVSALSLASESLLRSLGAWERMASRRLSPYSHMHVWDGEGTGTVDFDREDLGNPAMDHLGTIVENRVTQWALYEQVRQQANVTFMASALRQMRQTLHGWHLTLDNGHQFTPALLVGADGGRSLVRRLAGFRVRSWPYDHTAVVTTVKTERPHQQTAYQIFLPSGPLAFLPLSTGDTDSQHYCSIVWSADTDRARDIMSWDDGTFMRQSGQAFEYHLGEILHTDARHSFPLVQQHAVHYSQPGLALIGDAAHTIHPLAGQGINLGFLDAAVLAEEVAASVGRGLSPGERSGLRRYERRRKAHNLLTMSAMEGFKRIFEPLHWLLTTARNEGMAQFNRHWMARRQVVSHAVGVAGDLPELAKFPVKMDEKTAG